MHPSNLDAIDCTFRGDGSSFDVFDPMMGAIARPLQGFLSWASIEEITFAVTCKPRMSL